LYYVGVVDADDRNDTGAAVGGAILLAATIAVMAATAYEAHAVSRRRSMAMEGRYHQSMMMRMCDSAGRGSGGCAGGFQEAAPRELQEEAVAQQALQGGF